MEKGIHLKPQDQQIQVFVDADYAGNWSKMEKETDFSSARSRHGYIINYKGIPLFWASQLQTLIALSSTESEYIGLSQELRTCIPLMRLLEEMKRKGFDTGNTQPTMQCKLFEDNNGALELATVPKTRPRTKHINIRYHHFRSWVQAKLIKILPIDSEDQPADILTKPVNNGTLIRHRKKIMG